MNVFNDASLERLVDDLHDKSKEQSARTAEYFASRKREGRPMSKDGPERKAYMSDKLVALDRDKAVFCYMLCRAIGARRIVEAGTSHGVSTLYLAAALRDNSQHAPAEEHFTVIGTEYEPRKIAQAKRNFELAGLTGFLELREGDLRETLLDISGSIDFALIDIWIPMARPALELISPHLRAGAVVVCDNTASNRNEYEAYFDFLHDPANRFSTVTLPFDGGLEMSVRI